MLKKSYRELILWVIGFTVLMTAAAFLPVRDAGLLVRIDNNLCMIGVVLLMLLIWKTEKVFWINGISFEEAVTAGSGRRRAFAWKHVKLFGVVAILYLLFSLIAQLLHFSFWIDIAVIMMGCLAAGIISAMRFKL